MAQSYRNLTTIKTGTSRKAGGVTLRSAMHLRTVLLPMRHFVPMSHNVAVSSCSSPSGTQYPLQCPFDAALSVEKVGKWGINQLINNFNML